MHINRIIKPGDDEQLKHASDPELLILNIITMLVRLSLHDVCLVCDHAHCESYTRVGDETVTLPPPWSHDIDRLLSLLTDHWPEPLQPDQFGDFSKVCILSITGELVLCFFSYIYGHDAKQRGINIRLVYGESAPAAAGRLLPQYRRIWRNRARRTGFVTRLLLALSKMTGIRC